MMKNEREITKKMVKLINESKINKLNENIEETDENIKLEGQDYLDEIKGFMNTVSKGVDFGDFILNPKKNTATFSGTFRDFTGLTWQFNLNDGVYITATNFNLDLNSVETIKKLEGYFNVWSDTWSEKLNLEY
jgi:hypothetical protein